MACNKTLEFYNIPLYNTPMQRHLTKQLQEHFKKYKQVAVLTGPRQTGKTTLTKNAFPEAKYLLTDNKPIKTILETYDIRSYKQLISAGDTVVIDEVQRLENPGLASKIIYDQIPNVKLVLTGSSSLDIKSKINESLAGRRIDYQLFPLTFGEYLQQTGIEEKLNFNTLENILSGNLPLKKQYTFDIKGILENILIYGLYPELVNIGFDTTYLKNLTESIIFRDILDMSLIDSKQKGEKLLKLLAYQIGEPIKYSELGQKLQMDQRTVKRYIEIFEQTFIVFRLYPFSNNRRDEITQMPKIYFYDTGVRNALINKFDPLAVREDTGQLFENFIVNEAIKGDTYAKKALEIKYWKTSGGYEIDLVMAKGNDPLIGNEIKYRRGAVTRAFKNTFPRVPAKVINSGNFY